MDNEKVQTKTKRHWKCRKAVETQLQAPRYDILCWVFIFFHVLFFVAFAGLELSSKLYLLISYLCGCVFLLLFQNGLELHILRRLLRSKGSDKNKLLDFSSRLQVAGGCLAPPMLGIRVLKFSTKRTASKADKTTSAVMHFAAK